MKSPQESSQLPALGADGLVVRGASVSYGAQVALADADLSVPAGQILAVLGPSGCGKSTLLRSIAGLEPLTAGSIWMGSERVDTLPTHRRGFALMFQDGQLFNHLDVAANVAYPLRLRRTPRARAAQRVEELLEIVGLAGFGARRPGTLSGGERQRVALARALAVRPRLLLLDEPLSALDASLRERLAVDLREILHEAGTTALMVTHDHEEAFAVADSMAVMREGRLVQSGGLDEVWRHPVDEWTALFLGYSTVLSGAAADLVRASLPGSDGDRLGTGSVALRRSALVRDAAGVLEGVVVQSRATPEQVRLVVDVAGIGEVGAVTSLGDRVAVGERVRLRVDAERVAFTA